MLDVYMEKNERIRVTLIHPITSHVGVKCLAFIRTRHNHKILQNAMASQRII